MNSSPDIVIIGSGIGGATLAHGLAGSAASIVILERGNWLYACSQARDAQAIFIDQYFRTEERWRSDRGHRFAPNHYYCVGGNSKFFGTALFRFRSKDFEPIEHYGGISPGWPFPYEALEPWYTQAEELYQVRGALGEDPTEPFHSQPYPYPPVPDEPRIAEFRNELKAVGLHPSSLPLGIDIEAWLSGGRTGWDAYPGIGRGKMDAENCALRSALQYDNVELVTNACVKRLDVTAGRTLINAVHYEHNGEQKTITPKLVVLSAGAINSAVILIRSGDDRPLANSSDQVGRNYMHHNGAAVLAVDPRRRNDSIYQKTIAVNDFYFGSDQEGRPLGNVQMIGKVSGALLKSTTAWAPQFTLDYVAGHSVDCFLLCEDLPDPESRVTVRGGEITLRWTRPNREALRRLTKVMRHYLKECGYPIIFVRAHGEENTTHQCGTIRLGVDPKTAPLDPYCQSYDHRNLFVVDASFLPCSAAVNPSLTVAAQALRVADYLRRRDFRL